MQNLLDLKTFLQVAQRNQFAVGSFSPRATALIAPILRAAAALHSPVIIQVAQAELEWFSCSVAEFAGQFWKQYVALHPDVPVGLHLDHTQDWDTITAAIANGFTSVMIDASALPLEKNIAETRKVVEYAHVRHVSVEGELGRIGGGDSPESKADEVRYTDPREAARFVEETGVDALAISVGTAHGVYRTRQPHVDLERIRAIRALTPVPLVLHGGSGTPDEMIRNAIRLPEGGISKVNIATDLELALLAELGKSERLLNPALGALPYGDLERGRKAVERVVTEKITGFLGSQDQARAN
jgi:ketose-bisphosphate aldolase